MSESSASGAPPVLVVRAGRGEGVVPYENRGTQPSAPAAAMLHFPTLSEKPGEPLAQARVRGQVPPGATGWLRVKFTVDKQAAPGVHEGQVSLGDQTIAATVVVTERRVVRVTPSVLTVDGASPADAARPIVIQNRGNTPVMVDHPAAVRLEPMNRLCGVVREALAAAVGVEPKPIADALAEAAAKSVAGDPILAARFDRAPVEVAPGRQVALSMRLRIPTSLAEARYEAQLLIAGQILTIIVLGAPQPAP